MDETKTAEQPQGKPKAMSPQEAGRKGGLAPRRNGMTRQQAGRLGGRAPHRCRGFECQQRSNREEEQS